VELADLVEPGKSGAEVSVGFFFFGVLDGEGEVGDAGCHFTHALIKNGIVGEAFGDTVELFPGCVGLTELGHFFSTG